MSLADRMVRLTAKFDLLRELNAGRVLTHENLLRQVWGHEYSGDSGPTRTIVKRLRRKLGECERPDVHLRRASNRIPHAERKAAEP